MAYGRCLSVAATAVLVCALRVDSQQVVPTVRWRNATLDHFEYTRAAQTQFRQKILEHSGWWRPGGPLLVYFGNEGQIEDFWNATGAIFEHARAVNGFVGFLEHRYYGETLPFGALSTASGHAMRYLTIEQALADFSGYLVETRAQLGCGRGDCKTVLFGGSYGGMLAAWHRLKYPHLSDGAIAASAPVDLYPGEHKQRRFYLATLGVFSKYGTASCAATLDSALTAVAGMANSTSGRAVLSAKMATCAPLTGPGGVEQLLFYAKGALATLAMLDYPFACNFVTPMPPNPVKYACGRVATAADPIAALNAAVNVFLNYTGQLRCHNVTKELVGPAGSTTVGAAGPMVGLGAAKSLGDISLTWNYQACTELVLEPLTSDGDGFYVEDDSQIAEVAARCQQIFGDIVTRPFWSPMAYGTGADIARHTTNIVFSDGDKDPWSIGGVPANASAISPDGSVIHILIEDAAHHQDLRADDPRNSAGVVEAKALERQHIRKWLGLD